MYDHRPLADPALTPVLPPGLRFPYAIGRPGPNEPTGPRPRAEHDGPALRPARRTPPAGGPGTERSGARWAPPRGAQGDRPVPVRGGPSRTRAVDAVAAAFLAGEPRPEAGPRGPRRAWFDLPDAHRS
ncbi:hypothetical protein SUDANB121_03007 [Nocardiopsis dassonvillei]|uniref:hypothetical protein n=1 Tax=Nocardiopsis dassonvillei TaxID=2014 RepID=UPI003F556968